MLVASQMLKSTVWGIVQARMGLFKDNTFMKHFYRVMLSVVPALACGMLRIGDEGFVKLTNDFRGLLVDWITRVFAVASNVPNLTPDLYATKVRSLPSSTVVDNTPRNSCPCKLVRRLMAAHAPGYCPWLLTSRLLRSPKG
jgi:hypothetical protein